MAHFVYVRAGAVWANLSVLLPSETALFDQQLFKAVNGDDGGTWAPGAAINIGGSGLNVSGNFVASAASSIVMSAAGTLSVPAGAFQSLAGTLTVANGGVVSLLSGSQVTHQSGATETYASGSNTTWNSGANLTFNNNPTAIGAWTFSNVSSITTAGAIVVTGSLSISSGTMAFAGTYALAYGSAGTITRSGPETISGSAAQTGWRTGQLADSAGQTIGPTVDLVSVPPAASASRTVTVTHTTGTIPVVGTKIRFTWIINNSGFSWTMQREDTTPIFSVNNFAGPVWVEIVYAQYPGDVAPKWHFSAGAGQNWATGQISNVS